MLLATHRFPSYRLANLLVAYRHIIIVYRDHTLNYWPVLLTGYLWSYLCIPLVANHLCVAFTISRTTGPRRLVYSLSHSAYSYYSRYSIRVLAYENLHRRVAKCLSEALTGILQMVYALYILEFNAFLTDVPVLFLFPCDLGFCLSRRSEEVLFGVWQGDLFVFRLEDAALRRRAIALEEGR